MRKFVNSLFTSLLILLLLSFAPSIVLAQTGETSPGNTGISFEESEMILPYPTMYPTTNTLDLLGQEHNYSVVFRGNGEAVVSSRVLFINSTNKSLGQLKLRVPRVDPEEFKVFQVIKTGGQCRRYETTYNEHEGTVDLDSYRSTSGVCDNLTSRVSCQAATDGSDCAWYTCINECLSDSGAATNVCLDKNSGKLFDSAKKNASLRKTECVDYAGATLADFRSGTFQYQKANSDFAGDTLTINLPRPLAPNAAGAVLIHFRTFGYVRKTLTGGFNYTFETFKAEEEVSKVSVGIATDTDLLLKGAKGEVNYRFDSAAFSALESPSLGAAGASGNVALDRYYTEIGKGKITKTATNLAALESYKVDGRYAKSLPQLYAKEIGTLLGVGLVVLIVGIWVVKKLLKRLSSHKVSDEVNLKQSDVFANLLISGGTSFISVVIMAAYTIGIVYFGEWVTNFIGYQFNGVVILFMIIVSAFIYILLMFSPMLYFVAKKNYRWAFITIIFTLFWMVTFFVLALLVVGFLGSANRGGPVIY